MVDDCPVAVIRRGDRPARERPGSLPRLAADPAPLARHPDHLLAPEFAAFLVYRLPRTRPSRLV